MSRLSNVYKYFTPIVHTRNMYANGTFAVIGGGQSALSVPADFLVDKISIAVNYRPPNLKADFHILHDPLSLMWIFKNNVDVHNSSIILNERIHSYDRHNEHSDMRGWEDQWFSPNKNNFRDIWVGDIPVNEYLLYLVEMWLLFGKDIGKHIYRAISPAPTPYSKKPDIGNKWYSTGVWAIETAIYMGAKKIYLIGFDGGHGHCYSHPIYERILRVKGKDTAPGIDLIHRLADIVEIKTVNSKDNTYGLHTVNI
jgi:hypothetical protein